MFAMTARDLVNQRREDIFETYRDQIVSKITQTIDESFGTKNETRLDIDGLVSVWPVRMTPQLTSEQQAIIEYLFAIFDYGAQLVPDSKTFVPMGIRKADGSGPEYRRYMIEVAW